MPFPAFHLVFKFVCAGIVTRHGGMFRNVIGRQGDARVRGLTLGGDGSRCHYAIEPHGVTEEEVEATRQELSKSNTFALPSRQAAPSDASSAVPSMPPADGASYVAVSYATAQPQQSQHANEVVYSDIAAGSLF